MNHKEKALKLYEYAIILQPKEDSDGNVVEEGALLTKGELLANDPAQANIKVARMIPDEHLAHLERVDLAIRPF
jgi:hypothetical protein